MTPDDIAARTAQAMWDRDTAVHWAGFQMLEVTEGQARFGLTVAPHHCNGHGILHGGVTFALADTAFAYACNSRNQVTVAQTNTITFLAPGHAGDQITATARELQTTGRSGLYDVTVTRDDGTVLAEFRGQSRTLGGPIFQT